MVRLTGIKALRRQGSVLIAVGGNGLVYVINPLDIVVLTDDPKVPLEAKK